MELRIGMFPMHVAVSHAPAAAPYHDGELAAKPPVVPQMAYETQAATSFCSVGIAHHHT